MVCKLDRPSPQALFDRIKGNFSANVLGGFDVIPESNEWYVVSNDYAMAEEFYSIAEAQWKARDPRYACCADLYEMAARDGLLPKSAGFAQGYVRVTGTPGTAIPDGLTITIKGQEFTIVGCAPSVVPSTGYFDARVQAVVPGTDGNIAVQGGTGTLSQSAQGLDSAVEIMGSTFCGGSEDETCEAFRTRYLEFLAYQPRANQTWVINKIKEWPCVTRVFAKDYSGSCCRGAAVDYDCGCNGCTKDFDFYVLFDDTYDCGIPPQCVIDEMKDWLFGNPQGRGMGQVDITVCGDLIAPVASLINVRIAGLGCATTSEVEQVRERIRDVFANAAPSQLLPKRTIELAIAQVVGLTYNFEVNFDDLTGNMAFSPCGDMDPECDILPCLAGIEFVDSGIVQGACG